MYIPLKQVEAGQIYRTNNEDYPFAYVLRIVFEYALKQGIPHPDTVKEFDQIICRFFCRISNNEHFAKHEYTQSYETLDNKRFVEKLDLDIKFDRTTNKFYVEPQSGRKWYIEPMCNAVWQGSKIYSCANVYKFNYKLLVGRENYLSKSNYHLDRNEQIVDTLTNIIGLDKFIYFNHLDNILGGMPTRIGTLFYFYDETDYNLARIALPIDF